MATAAQKRFFTRMERQGLMLTYDDVRLRTSHSEIEPSDADVHTMFSRRVSLNIPIVSSPMDTVTTSRMAIALAEAGGLGIIHRGLSPDEQAKRVARVKHRLNERIETPVTVQDDMRIQEVLAMRDKKNFPFHTFPVLNTAGKVVGLVTANDFDFCMNTDVSLPVSAVMTPIEELRVALPRTEPREAFESMRASKKKVLPLIADDGSLAGMYLFSNLKRIFSGMHSDHNVDSGGQLVVGAAVGTGEGALIRAEVLAKKKCDVFVIDTAHGDSKNVIDTVKELTSAYPNIDVVAGNVSSGSSAKRLVDAGADGILVGQGPGSICTTRVVAGVGVPQVSALWECSQAIRGSGVPICADGGINNSGDMVIALAVGASTVMLGRLLAGTDETPGEVMFDEKGRQVKDYRGMGSFGAMRENRSSREKYGQSMVAVGKVVPEGIEGIVPYRGTVKGVLEQYVGGIRAGMGYNGARTMKELRLHAEIFRISSAGLAESHPHDVTITAQSPNYHGRGA